MAANMMMSATLKLLQSAPRGVLAQTAAAATNLQFVRGRRTKHWDPKWKKLRAQKVVKVELPDYDEGKKNAEMSAEEMRSKMKEKGIQPPRPWMERPFYISSTGGVFEPYVPPEGDGRISAVTKQGAKQKLEFLEKKSKSMMAVRKIRTFDEDFDRKDFVQHAQDIYIKAHQLLMSKDKLKLREFVTERAYPEMMHNALDKTLVWGFVQSLEPPRVVHARCTDVITKENIFAQVTVRFHTQQTLAVYDRFGRLHHGHPTEPRDVLEYVVFERHLADLHGAWRLHDKLVPDWLPPRSPARITFTVDQSKASLPAEVPPPVEALPPPAETAPATQTTQAVQA